MHSVKMVLRNLKEAMQVSLVPALIGSVLAVLLFFLFDAPHKQFENATAASPDASAVMTILGFLFCLLIVVFAVMLWIVVSWHRFVLLKEYPRGVVPPFRLDRVLAYFGRLLMLILLGLAASIPAGIVMGMMTQASAVLGLLFWIAFIVFLTIAFYRASPILPAAAIGRPIKLSDAWRSTSGASGTLAVLVIVSVLFQMLLQFLASLLLFVPIIGIVIVIFAGMLIVPLINVSILTTIYGVFIEKRELT
ncbi:hypothetical protein [Ruegeria sp.]|uniref:hypothetical protein n=1 Tax=Ruegeria sp. TaxID=1879320 RepID=UPI003C7ABE15